MDVFARVFAIVIGEEGGFCDERDDPGNWSGGRVGAGVLRGTKFGISAAAYPALDIAALTPEQAREIYRRDYWAGLQGDALPPPVALLAFDAAVNNGPARAVRWLQAAAGVAADGVIGPVTLAAIARAELPALAAELLAQRLEFMAALPTWRDFGRGWARRLCALPFHAMALAG